MYINCYILSTSDNMLCLDTSIISIIQSAIYSDRTQNIFCAIIVSTTREHNNRVVEQYKERTSKEGHRLS